MKNPCLVYKACRRNINHPTVYTYIQVRGEEEVLGKVVAVGVIEGGGKRKVGRMPHSQHQTCTPGNTTHKCQNVPWCLQCPAINAQPAHAVPGVVCVG